METGDDIRDFVVQITELKVGDKGGVHYLGQVTDSPNGRSTPEELKVPFGGESFELVRLRLENAVLSSQGYRGSLESRQEKVLQQFGAGMFEVLFRSNVGIRERHEACKRDIDNSLYDGLRIKLEVISHELASLPWEFMFDTAPPTSGYLCLARNSPVLRHLGDLRRKPVALGRKIKVLAMVANPPGFGGRLNVAHEREVLDALSNDATVGDRFQLSWVLGDRLDDLINHINKDRWDIFHFVGHGGFDDGPDAEDSGYVVMGDGKGSAERVFAQDLANTLRLCGSVQLAVLNCCESARGNGSASPGAALARASIPAVVAMQYPIADATAVAFTEVFYRALLNGKMVEQALTTARVSMHQRSKVEWGIPVLYSRSSSGEAIRFWSSAREETPFAPAALPDVPAGASLPGLLREPAEKPQALRADDSISEQEVRRRERQKRVKAMFNGPSTP